MSNLLQIRQKLTGFCRERSGDPTFWAEPLNALTNASFLIAAAFALALAIRRQKLTATTGVLVSLAGVVEPFLLMGAACTFALAITARACDWIVPCPLVHTSCGISERCRSLFSS
jgi:hypothetical protein